MVEAKNRSAERLNTVTCPKKKKTIRKSLQYLMRQLTEGTTQTYTLKDIVGN